MNKYSYIGKEKRNNLGFIRLLFASLVIISHSSELIYGSRIHEPLFILSKTISLGDLAVNGFFIISGYLIAKSYMDRKSVAEYLTKRVLRIYPGFIAAWLFSAIIVLPLAGGRENFLVFYQFWKIIFLNSPTSQMAFSNTFFPSLNAPLWTIPWEFFCYILTIFMGYSRILKARYLVVILSLLLLFMPHLLIRIGLYNITASYFGVLLNGSRLVGMFFAGMAMMLYRDNIKYDKFGILVSIVIIIISIRFSSLVSIGIATGGAYIIFMFGFNFKSDFIASINSKTDISYGVYLYAWPISKLLILYFKVNSFISLCGMTFILSVVFGYLSWVLIEKPSVNFGKRLISA